MQWYLKKLNRHNFWHWILLLCKNNYNLFSVGYNNFFYSSFYFLTYMYVLRYLLKMINSMKVYFYSSKIMFLSIKEKCLKCKQIETTSLYSLFFFNKHMCIHVRTCTYVYCSYFKNWFWVHVLVTISYHLEKLKKYLKYNTLIIVISTLS